MGRHTPGQTSELSAATAITIKRHRAPVLSIGKVVRGQTTAHIPVTITDTGYGGTQAASQISGIEYKLGSGAWTAAPLNGWSGLQNSFDLTGLAEGSRYSLQVRATNAAPAGTALAAKVSAINTAVVLAYSPELFIWSDSSGGGAATKRLIVGTDYEKSVAEGWAVIQNGIKIADKDVPTVETGTWVPTLIDIGSRAATLSEAYGNYAKVGNEVRLTGVVTLSALASVTTTDYISIGGMPFAVAGATVYPTANLWEIGNLAMNSGTVYPATARKPVIAAQRYGTALRLYWERVDGAGLNSFLFNQLAAGTQLRFTVTYRIA